MIIHKIIDHFENIYYKFSMLPPTSITHRLHEISEKSDSLYWIDSTLKYVDNDECMKRIKNNFNDYVSSSCENKDELLRELAFHELTTCLGIECSLRNWITNGPSNRMLILFRQFGLVIEEIKNNHDIQSILANRRLPIKQSSQQIYGVGGGGGGGGGGDSNDSDCDDSSDLSALD